jgi:broad specificity phosphatase PhoE
MTRLLLIRHGQSVSNVSQQFTGQSDVPLSLLGIKQAEKTADYIANNFKVDAIYASDLSRAFDTAKAVAEKIDLKVIPDKNLREIFAGKWEMMPYNKLLTEYNDEYQTWLNDNPNARPTGGESVEELKTRVYNEIIKIAKENDGKTVVIATHATPIRTFISRCLSLNDFSWVPNASVTVVEFKDNKFSIKKTGISEHLGELETNLPKEV